MQEIAAAIVNWNTRDLLCSGPRSVLAQEVTEVVAADNCSRGGSVQMVPGQGRWSTRVRPGASSATVFAIALRAAGPRGTS